MSTMRQSTFRTWQLGKSAATAASYGHALVRKEPAIFYSGLTRNHVRQELLDRYWSASAPAKAPAANERSIDAKVSLVFADAQDHAHRLIMQPPI